MTKRQREDIKFKLLLQSKVDASKQRNIQLDDELIVELSNGDMDLICLYGKWFTYYSNNLDKIDYVSKEFVSKKNKDDRITNKVYIVELLKVITKNPLFNINKITDLEEANKNLVCNTLIKVYNKELDDKRLRNLSEFWVYGDRLEKIEASVKAEDGNICRNQVILIDSRKKVFDKAPKPSKMILNMREIEQYITNNYK